MKKFYLLILTFFVTVISFANHITGGEIFYVFNGMEGGKYKYTVTLKLYKDCFAPPGSADLDPTAPIAIFNNATNQMVWRSNVEIAKRVRQELTNPSPCIQNPPPVCYEVGYYEFQVTLDGAPQGYTITYQRCCRIAGINNLVGSNGVGATYTAQIPGTSILATAPENNSAKFTGKDEVIICKNTSFVYDFGASDADGDGLTYSFCSAYTSQRTPPDPNPPLAPPYEAVPYNASYSATTPLGLQATIDPKTGLITGIAPGPGIYVITVCVTEWRNNMAIAIQRKDLQIKIGDCSIALAELNPSYITCDGFTFLFQNEAPPNPIIKSYLWEIGGTTYTSTTPLHTFADTGTYKIRLVINQNEACSDSAFSEIRVYPGFVPDFTLVPCQEDPKQFLDRTTTRYGVVNNWQWNFGEEGATNDSSRVQNPSFSYPSTGTKNVTLIVSNSKGCIDTVSKQIRVREVVFAGRDTAVVAGQKLQLNAQGGDFYRWNPPTDLNNPNIKDPIAIYDGSYDSIRYTLVATTGEGCIDSAHVRVKIYNTKPQIFVPTAFTPNGDGRNDVLRPVPVGMTTISYFRVYNRWGQLVFETTSNETGWNGKIKDQYQRSGTYVWIAKGVDYTGKVFFAKGTSTLIR